MSAAGRCPNPGTTGGLPRAQEWRAGLNISRTGDSSRDCSGRSATFAVRSGSRAVSL